MSILRSALYRYKMYCPFYCFEWDWDSRRVWKQTRHETGFSRLRRLPMKRFVAL